MSEASWESRDVVEQRRKGAEARNRFMAEANETLFDEAGVRPGIRVLELGGGTGDVAVMLAERVGREGSVVATDASAAMLETARAVVRDCGVTNVTLDVCDASAIRLPEASFDAVVARNVLMFLDLDVALPSVHRVMRPGARFGATVWGPATHNPFHGAVLDAVRAEGGWGDAKMEVVQAFSRGDRATYEAAFAKAGFRDVRVRVVGAVRKFANVAAARASVEESRIHTAPITNLDPTRQASAWKRVEQQFATYERGGALEIPTEWSILGATK